MESKIEDLTRIRGELVAERDNLDKAIVAIGDALLFLREAFSLKAKIESEKKEIVTKKKGRPKKKVTAKK